MAMIVRLNFIVGLLTFILFQCVVAQGGIATYICILGYTVGDSSNTTYARACTNGSWTGQVPSCTPIDCGFLSNPSNGEVNVNPNNLYEATATYMCNEGYMITSGNSSRTCTADGSWSGSEPTCSRKDCGPLSNPSNGVVNVNPNNLYEATATYLCNEGYMITSGDSSRTCTAGGSWSGSEPTCSRKDCGPLSNPSNGVVNVNPNNLYEATATYLCNEGYMITSGNSRRTCTAVGSWSGSEPTCSKKDCGNLVNPANGQVSVFDSLYQGTAQYTCNIGYDITGTSSNTLTVTCTSSGTWSQTGVTCTIKDCGNLNNPANGQVSVSNSKYLGTALYTCNTGYDIAGTSSNTLTVTCTSSGTWSQTGVTCTIKDCGSPPNPQNGVVSASVTTYQAVATYTCITGYIISGTVSETTTTITCTAAGSWSETVTCSIKADPLGVTCPNPSSTNLSPGRLCTGANALCLQLSSTSQEYTCQCNTGYYDNNGYEAAGQCRPISELAVHSITFTSVTTTGMIVSWTPPTNKANFISGYSIEWRPTDNSVAGSSTQSPITTTTYTIANNVVSGTAYIVKVISQNKVNYTETVKTIFTQKEQALKPQKPGSIIKTSSNLDAQDKMIYLVWVASAGTVYRYEVRLYDSGSQNALVTLATSTSTPNINLSYQQMKNGHRYNVSIIAVSQQYDGTNVARSDEHREQIKTVVQRPSPPSSVQCQMTTDNSVTIIWQEPTTPNGDLIEYKIDTYLYNQGGSRSLIKTENTGDLDLSFEILGLDPGSYYFFNVSTINEQYTSDATRLAVPYCQTRARNTYYNVIITAINEEGRGRMANQTVRTDEEAPQKPKDITISNLSPTSCTVAWNIEGPRPGSTTYTVVVDAASPVTHSNHQLIGFNNRVQDLTGLQEYWNYTVKVRAETSKGYVNSDPMTFRTLAAAPGPVENFYIIFHPNFDFTKIFVEWKVPALLERNSVIDSFLLYHNASENMDERMMSFPKNADDHFTYTHVFNITPEVYYTFKVLAVNTDNQNGTESVRTVRAPAKDLQDDTKQETSNIAVIAVAVIAPTVVIATIAIVAIVIYRQRSAKQVDSCNTRVETQSKEWNESMNFKTTSTQSIEFKRNMTNKEVLEWLKDNNLYKFKAHFKEYTGDDLIKLSKEDLKSICGAADGIRMYNRLRESTADYNTPQEEQAYMDLDDTQRDGVPYENIEMDRTHMYSSLEHV